MAAGRRFRIRAADRDIADFLVRKGILTATELEDANRLQWSKANNWGDLPPLSSALKELKFLPPPDLLARLEKESTYATHCDTCESEITIPFFDPDRAYLCHHCKAMLMTFELAPNAPAAGTAGVEEISEEEPSAQDIPPPVSDGAEATPASEGVEEAASLPSWMAEDVGGETLLDARSARPSEEVASPRASTGEDTILELGPARGGGDSEGSNDAPEPGGQGFAAEPQLPEWMNEKAGEDTLLDAGPAMRAEKAAAAAPPPSTNDDEGVDIEVEPTVLSSGPSEEIALPAASDEPTDVVDLVPDELTTEPAKFRGEEPGSLGFGSEGPVRDWMEDEVLQAPRMKAAPPPPAEEVESVPKAAGEDSLLDIGTGGGKAADVEPDMQKTVEVAPPGAYEPTIVQQAPQPVPAKERSPDDPPEIEEAPVPDYYKEESAILEIPLPTLNAGGPESTLTVTAGYKDLAKAWSQIAHKPKQLLPALPVLGPPPPREPKSTSTTTDFTIMIGEGAEASDTATGATIVVGGSATSTGTTIELADSRGKGASQTDATLLVGDATAGRTPRSRTTATGGTLPLTGGRAGIAGKALPPEVQAASKDAKRVFGKYILTKELGRGGAGVVYKAWDTLLTQYVAIKFLRDQDFAEDESATSNKMIEDFQHEARMSAKLRHPNIVRIYEMGCMSNRYYLSMEYVDGGSLFEVIHGSKERNTKTMYHTNPDKFLALVRDVALAVDHAHKQDPPVVHRDLKPHNVLLDQKGTPFVADFGLAKEVESFGTSQQNTVTGVVKGTPSYMAPEQAEGKSKDVDGRTDVYSLGAVLYEAITGVPPFIGDNIRAVLNRIVHEEPVRPNDAVAKLAQEQPDATNPAQPVPKALETICLKALEKRKADRYQSAKEFADDLERFRLAEEIIAKEPGVLRKIKRKIVKHPLVSLSVAAILLAAGAFVGATYLLPKPPENQEELIARAVERAELDLKNRDWEGLKRSIEELRQQASGHLRIPEFEKAISDHEAYLKAAREEWKGALPRVQKEPLKPVVADLRAKHKKHAELQAEFRESFRAELAPLPAALVAQAKQIVGAGPKPAWVEEFVKQGARTTRDQIVALLELAKDPDLPFTSDAPLTESLQSLERVIAYLGTWTLQVNVVPYAEVTLLQDKRVIASDLTPMALLSIEVSDKDFQVELCWPSRDKAQVRVSHDVKDLKHAQTVVISGDIAASKTKIERR